MSKSTNMLRTRRRDVNIKPNRRLDRKSSRGMIYENEELRLRTININAEIERGQSDIKKLRRENEQLRKEIWCLRDEYDKLDKLLKEKESDSCTSSTGSSDSESGTSCSESEETETSQNLENVQKNNLKNLHVEFDHLSVVPEENSTENSEKNSNRTSVVNENGWNFEAGIIKPDQSYPNYDAFPRTSHPNSPKNQEKTPTHFFSPMKIGQTYENYINNQFLGRQRADNQEGTLQTVQKCSPDVMVKSDNQGFAPVPPHTSFSNGGNLEELLNDIETISNDILQMSSTQNKDDIIAKIQNSDLSYVSNTKIDNYDEFEDEVPENFETIPGSPRNFECPTDKPYKSELSVVLMPTPMPIIGFDKYRNLQDSLDSINSKSLEKLSVSYENLRILPDNIGPDNFYNGQRMSGSQVVFAPPSPKLQRTNPFYFGSLPNNGGQPRFLDPNRDICIGFKREILDHVQKIEQPPAGPENVMYSSKSNLLDLGPPSDQISSENEENLKFKTSKCDDKAIVSSETETTSGQVPKKEIPKPKDGPKSPKLRKTRKVSIYFKGKKDKQRSLSLDATKGEPEVPEAKPVPKKHSFLESLRLGVSSDSKSGDKKKVVNKTSSVESKVSNCENSTTDSKTPASVTSVETPNFDVKQTTPQLQQQPDATTSGPAAATKTGTGPEQQQQPVPPQQQQQQQQQRISDSRKSRKSQSTSPERKHVHMDDGGGKKTSHKKHHKKDRSKTRRSTVSADRYNRERSFSICTNRSNNLLDVRRFGYGLYDEGMFNSDRERSNSMSSCDTLKERKMSNISNIPTGKIPWCGCWGNGCL